MLKRTIRYLALGATGLTGSVIACGSPSSGNTGPITSATVNVDVYGSNGLKAGSCLGTVISSDTVLTAGHCVAGFSWWQVTTGSGQVAHSSIGYTYDWQNFESDLSHPNHYDVATLKLDTQVTLAQYPAIASSNLVSGAAAMRVRPAASGGVEAIAAVVQDGNNFGFPDYYGTSLPQGEALVTGGALIDPTSNTIYGVTSGRGDFTGELYMSRVEPVAQWISSMASCSATSGTTTPTVSAQLTTECNDHGPIPDDCGVPTTIDTCDGGETTSGDSGGDDAGLYADGGTTGSSSGSSSTSSSSGASSSSGGSSSGSSSGSGTTGGSGGTTTGSGEDGGTVTSSGGGTTGGSPTGDGGTACGGGGICQGTGCSGTTGGGSGSSGSSSSSSSGGGSSGSSSGSGAGSSGNGSTGSNGSSGASGSGSSSGTASGSGSSSGSGTTGSSSGSSSGSGTTGSSSGSSSGSGVGSSGNGSTASSGSGSGSSSGSSSGSGTTGSSSGSSSGSGYNGGSNGGVSSGGNGTTGSSGGSGGDNSSCNDSTCGGCDPNDPTCTDNTIDYGGVPGTGGGGETGDRPY